MYVRMRVCYQILNTLLRGPFEYPTTTSILYTPNTISIPLTNLLHAIYHSIQQTHHLITHKSGVIFLNKMPTAHCCDGPNGFALVGDTDEAFVVAPPCGVGVRHGEDLGDVQATLVWLGVSSGCEMWRILKEAGGEQGGWRRT